MDLGRLIVVFLYQAVTGTSVTGDLFDVVQLMCRWDGTAPFCKGECKIDEFQWKTSKSGDGAYCWTGIKAKCCHVFQDLTSQVFTDIIDTDRPTEDNSTESTTTTASTESESTTTVVDVTAEQISTEEVFEKEMEAFVSNRSLEGATEVSTQQFSEEEVVESKVTKSRTVTPSVVWMNAG